MLQIGYVDTDRSFQNVSERRGEFIQICDK